MTRITSILSDWTRPGKFYILTVAGIACWRRRWYTPRQIFDNLGPNWFRSAKEEDSSRAEERTLTS